MKVVPAIDLLNGKVVRLSKGKFDSKIIYNDDPLIQAKLFEDEGFEWIHIVDLEGSKVGGSPNLSVVKKIVQNSSKIKIQFGGGVRSLDNVKSLFNIGVHKVIIGSLSAKASKIMKELAYTFERDRIIIASDIMNNKIVIKGWTESTQKNIYEHIKSMKEMGFTNFLCTDVSKDGMLTGPNFELYKYLVDIFPGINIIASGGVSCFNDLVQLDKIKLHACVVGKSIYENRISLKEIKGFGD